jgi:hypothetical protein
LAKARRLRSMQVVRSGSGSVLAVMVDRASRKKAEAWTQWAVSTRESVEISEVTLRCRAAAARRECMQ